MVINYEEISAPPLDQDALIVEKLSDDPDISNRFLQVREVSNSTQNAPTQEDNPPHELLPIRRVTDKKSGQLSKYSFCPRDDQQRVGERITSAKHKDKSTTLFCKRLVRSVFIKFKPLPGVCTRLYDIQFGSCRLPICHFAPFSHDERMAWLQAGSSNFDNLSALAEFTAARAPSSIDEVGDNAKVCSVLGERVESFVVFIKETLMRVSWSLNELPSLVYWVNDVLDDFRGATETEEDMTIVRSRCTTEDRLLREIMFVEVHREVETIRNNMLSASSQPAAESTNADPREQSTRNSKIKSGFIPRHVLKRLPLCMLFLSNDGCARDCDECPHDRAHFIPKKLPDIVKVEKKFFGRLKSDHKRL
ncbi:hypothetical protein PHMEG_00015444 [Phytophthora megakarya]|uniref:Uncharacterized protein n=1 Tax=Phytophthora megakarya TaxID=4795 RepID=A0A225W3D0_9STRA|nr:hypothetical protein PHMEG_00015444 [Phytophthora megakarya]